MVRAFIDLNNIGKINAIFPYLFNNSELYDIIEKKEWFSYGKNNKVNKKGRKRNKTRKESERRKAKGKRRNRNFKRSRKGIGRKRCQSQ